MLQIMTAILHLSDYEYVYNFSLVLTNLIQLLEVIFLTKNTSSAVRDTGLGLLSTQRALDKGSLHEEKLF